MKDYYAILGLSKNADITQIKKRFRELAHIYHPDKNGGSDKIFKEINEAYQVLGDSKNRFFYDQSLELHQQHYSAQSDSNQPRSSKPKKFELWVEKIKSAVSTLMTLGFAIFVLWAFISNSSDSQTDYKKTATSPPAISSVERASFKSLDNGTVILKDQKYLKGLGELTIENGTDMDALIKLVNISADKSIYSVYIAANSNLTIKNISNGLYRVIFHTGYNWGEDKKSFIVQPYYQAFEDEFDFTTKKTQNGDYIRTHYSTFTITLNPVAGGTAETEGIDSLEFEKY